MRIGIICEGHTDRAVIKNLIKGITGIEYSSLIAIRPEDDFDDTDLAKIDPNSFGSWTNVRNECLSRDKIAQFLSIVGQQWIVIQLDSLQANDYGVQPPTKDRNYSKKLRDLIIEQIKNWLNHEHIDNIAFAVAIEEIESWLLTIFVNTNSTSSASPKAKLKTTLRRMNKKSVETYENYFSLSESFSKKKNHSRNNYSSRNESLLLFCTELEKIITNAGL